MRQFTNRLQFAKVEDNFQFDTVGGRLWLGTDGDGLMSTDDKETLTDYVDVDVSVYNRMLN